MSATEAQRAQALEAAFTAGVRHDRGDVFLRLLDLDVVPRTATGVLDPDALAAAVQTGAGQVPELCREGAVPLTGGPRRAAAGPPSQPPGIVAPLSDVESITTRMLASVGIRRPSSS